ncbi:agmatine deiminase family protein [Pseudidiomarina insulisalsae]|uniref:Agmatine deiminase n=1 Tax=Pseudidiomarina insulisalsae TaxID=575789 RepID=A0A432YHY9_9GAMM|nr:agmatine deiminase family protein [Pseudidiomarina insulisalsae]RUO60554.1 hypothetical protein CWI71_06715 [Pseudidiomarina insulisalsae]
MKLLADWQLAGPLLTCWPYRNDVWRGNGEFVQQALLAMLHAILPYYPVTLAIHPPQLNIALRQLPQQLTWLPLAYDDAWIRDFGPLFRSGPGGLSAVAGQFDGWQGVHGVYQRDQRFAAALAHRRALPLHSLPFIFEGGMLSHDGAGTAVVHACSLQRRNPQWRLAALERELKRALGLQQIIWLHQALSADETGGHTDNQLQFVDAHSIVYVTSTDDPAWNEEVATLQRQPWGRAYRWIELPAAQQVTDAVDIYHDVRRRAGVQRRGQRPLLCSYANLLRLPGALVVPQFGLADDSAAVAGLQQAFPELAVIPVDALEMVRGGGGPHCLSLVLPG